VRPAKLAGDPVANYGNAGAYANTCAGWVSVPRGSCENDGDLRADVPFERRGATRLSISDFRGVCVPMPVRTTII